MVVKRCAMISVVRPAISRSSASSTSPSVSTSSALVGSSRIRIGASFSSARAMATRCRSPPESVAPRSPITVSYPCASRLMNSCALAACAAASTSCRVAPGLPYAMLSATLMGKRNGSCSTSETCPRRLFSVTSRTSMPSISTRPCQGSKKRGTSPTSVLLPAPVAPTSASVCPGSTTTETSCSTGRSAS
jgi:hypothetical protein